MSKESEMIQKFLKEKDIALYLLMKILMIMSAMKSQTKIK